MVEFMVEFILDADVVVEFADVVVEFAGVVIEVAVVEVAACVQVFDCLQVEKTASTAFNPQLDVSQLSVAILQFSKDKWYLSKN